MAKVRIIDEQDAGHHYQNRKTPAFKRLDRLADAGILKRVDVFQPGRGNFKAYTFANKDVARVMGGKLPTIGSKRNALHEVITSKLFYAADRKSTRLNSSHVRISYAVFCLKKKKHLIAEFNDH